MNGAVKFHKPESPAFNPGEVWIGASGIRVVVISVRRWGPERWDASVKYFTNPAVCEDTHEKDCWNFQVRYNHSADEVAKRI